METKDLACLIRESLAHVKAAIEKDRYAGYDKYSLRDTDFIRRMNARKHVIRRTALRPYNFVLNYFPNYLIKILDPPKLIHPKAMGLFADAYLDLYCVYKDEEYKLKAQVCMDWLLENSSPDYSKYCWGVPFNWTSKGTDIPANTPIASVSSICLDAFWRWDNLFQDKRYNDVPLKICDALQKSLYKHDDLPDDVACYSYTARDRLRVINGNLFIAEKLFLLSRYFNREEGMVEGKKILAYCIKNINSDGTFPYQGHEVGDEGKSVDAYHNGFILRSLYRIYRLYPSGELLEVLRQGFNAYLQKFVRPNGETWVQPGRRIIDIHGCAETILCLGRLMTLFPEGRYSWDRSIRWTLGHMQNHRTGNFYYRKLYLSSMVQWTVDVPYIRWADAWMFKALTEALLILEGEGIDW